MSNLDRPMSDLDRRLQNLERPADLGTDRLPGFWVNDGSGFINHGDERLTQDEFARLHPDARTFTIRFVSSHAVFEGE